MRLSKMLIVGFAVALFITAVILFILLFFQLIVICTQNKSRCSRPLLLMLTMQLIVTFFTLIFIVCYIIIRSWKSRQKMRFILQNRITIHDGTRGSFKYPPALLRSTSVNVQKEPKSVQRIKTLPPGELKRSISGGKVRDSLVIHKNKLAKKNYYRSSWIDTKDVQGSVVMVPLNDLKTKRCSL